LLLISILAFLCVADLSVRHGVRWDPWLFPFTRIQLLNLFFLILIRVMFSTHRIAEDEQRMNLSPTMAPDEETRPRKP
jgi:hypothetical protein